MATIKQLKRLEQSIEIFYCDKQGNQSSRVFKLVEHSRDELDQFIDLQVKCGEEAEKEAIALSDFADEEHAGELTKKAFSVPAKVAAPVAAFCLQFPEDGAPAPDSEWVCKHLTSRRMRQVIELQEELDGIDDSLKKNVNLIQAFALKARMDKMTPSEKPKRKKSTKKKRNLIVK